MTQTASNSATDPSEQVPGHVLAPAGDQENELPNLTACDVEPITRLERIQSFGFLLAMSRSWVFVRVSANLEGMLGIKPAAALGATLDSFVDPESLHEIRNRMTVLSGESLLTELTVSKPYDREALQHAIALTLARVASRWS